MKTSLLILLLMLITLHLRAETTLPTLAPGYGNLQFTAPKPNTYTLQWLGKATDGHVVDTRNQDITLGQLMGNNKVTLLSFIYAACSDVNGCPLATMVLHKIKTRLQHEPELTAKLRILTLSFNPQYDTPAVMKHYGKDLQDNALEWHFLTTRSEAELQPILTGYQQHIQKLYNAQGNDTATFSHVLRVYLIDQNQQLRNIYSTSFLHPDTLINDIKSLVNPILPTTQTMPVSAQASSKKIATTATYTQALLQRNNKATDLLATLRHPPLGLPSVPVPQDNPVTAAKVSLGRKLFYDRRLSFNNTLSCAMCHIPEQGFTSNEMATAVGVEGRTVRRNSPSLYNTAYFTQLFHDGRENLLEQQAWLPLLAHNEMANPSIGYVIDKIKHTDDYLQLFQQAFNKLPSMETLGMALANYERTLNSANSPFDRWYFEHNKYALNVKAQHGLQLFMGKANCSQCHTIGAKYALFTDNNLHNTGIGYQEAMQSSHKQQSVQLAPDIFVQVETRVINSVSAPKPNDLGRYEITQNPQDRWKYKTPTLRNVSLTAPYMHNGSLATLQDVVTFYNQGGVANENLDPLIKPLQLTAQEIADLSYFLTTLTGDNVQQLVSDALAAPVGDAH